MQIGNCWLKIDSTGSNIALTGITPAEAAILNADHEANAKGVAIYDVVVTANEERSGEAEINRLRDKYANAKNKKGDSLATVLYPGKSPVLPQTFKEIGIDPIGGQSEGPKAAKVENKQPIVSSQSGAGLGSAPTPAITAK